MSMKLVVVLFLLCLFSANAFLKSSCRILSPHVLQATALDIKGKNIEITEALREKVESKIGGVLAKLGDNAMSTSVILRVEKNDPKGSDIVECTVTMKGGASIHLTESQADMYVAIDSISSKVGEKLKQAKSKQKDKDSHRKESVKGGEGTDALVDEMEKM